MNAAPAPGWYADPYGRHEARYFDGTGWTEHVASHGRPGVDPPVAASSAAAVPTVQRDPEKIRGDVYQAGQAGFAAFDGGGSLFSEPVLVVNQKAKFIEVSNEYAIFDQHAQQIGAVRQVGQSTLKRAARLLSSMDQYLTHTLQLVDMQGTPQLTLTRPAKLIKSRIVVTDPAGAEIGQIVQQNVFGRIRFGLHADGQQIGSINGENWIAWNWNITDHAGVEVARITKTWEGALKTMFTTADNYVVQIHRPLQPPLLPLVVAAAVSVDTALKQDQRGFN